LALKIYNTLSRQKEDFVPLEDNYVKIYVCGVTLYDELHLGHARAAVVFDVIVRYLEHKNYKVKYITNFTDVDDKMINRAKSLGISIFDLSKKFIGEYFQQMKFLGVKRANYYPCATQHIKEIIELIKKLEIRGLAYPRDGNVFFRVRKFPSYGKLSGQNLENIDVGARIEVDEKKDDPLDFALWKKAKEGEPSWDSPWGRGRPGWHIECSAMAIKYLGESIDIHGGGRDLIFPHHENEIAQSEAATGKQFAKYWVHNGLVITKGQKMSKSIGNVLTLSQALKKYTPEAIRYFLLSAHYRSPLEYNENSLEEATSSLERVYTVFKRIKELKEKARKDLSLELKREKEELSNYLHKMEEKFTCAMDDDFNTPLALSVIFEGVKKANFLLGKEELLDEHSYQLLMNLEKKIRSMGRILGLFQQEEKILGEREERLVQLLVKVRSKLREKKEWGLADEIRKELSEVGIELEDKRDRTVWRVKTVISNV